MLFLNFAEIKKYRQHIRLSYSYSPKKIDLTIEVCFLGVITYRIEFWIKYDKSNNYSDSKAGEDDAALKRRKRL